METGKAFSDENTKIIQSFQAQLREVYMRKNDQARRVILEGKAVGNPLLTDRKDPRFSLALIARIHGRADLAFEAAIYALGVVEPDIRAEPYGYRHISIDNYLYAPEGRREAHIDAVSVGWYYEFLRHRLTNIGPIKLYPHKIIPVLDAAQPSISVVQTWLPKDRRLWDIREAAYQELSDRGLPVEKPKEINMIHSTLVRLPNPPIQTGGTVPLLDRIDTLNKYWTVGPVTLREIDATLGGPKSFIWDSERPIIYPPIRLDKREEEPEKMKFIWPSVRLQYDKSREKTD